MRPPAGERRARVRTPRFLRQQITVTRDDANDVQLLSGRLVDQNEGGWGIELPAAIPLGTMVTLGGEAIKEQGSARGRVVWCTQRGAVWRVGLVDAGREDAEDQAGTRAGDARREGTHTFDYYELMQLSPNADQDTVNRVYRMLAQRYHPDNRETGDVEAFRRLTEAYRVLGDPEQRAGYDADHQALRRRRWKIFDQPKTAQGVEAERRKRRGILGLLYTKRSSEPQQAAMGLFEIEDLLGVPREHLEFSLWYLKEHALITRTDNARYAITVRGVDEFENSGAPALRADRLLPDPAGQPGSAAA